MARSDSKSPLVMVFHSLVSIRLSIRIIRSCLSIHGDGVPQMPRFSKARSMNHRIAATHSPPSAGIGAELFHDHQPHEVVAQILARKHGLELLMQLGHGERLQHAGDRCIFIVFAVALLVDLWGPLRSFKIPFKIPLRFL